MTKVVKFGGSSLASAEQFKKGKGDNHSGKLKKICCAVCSW